MGNDQNFYKALFDAIPDPIFYKTVNGIYKEFNIAFCNFLGLKPDEIKNKSISELTPNEMATVYAKADAELLKNRGVQKYETRLLYADGTFHDIVTTKGIHYDANGEPMGIIGIIHDISDKKAAEREITLLHKVKDIFLSINHQMLQFQSEEQLLQAFLELLIQMYDPCEQGTVLALTPNHTLIVIAQAGYKENLVEHFEIPFEESFIWQDSPGNIYGAHIVNDISEYVAKGAKEVSIPEAESPVSSELVVPIWINDALKWIIALDSTQNHIYDDTDQKVADYICAELPLLYRIFDLYLKTLQMSRYESLTGLINRRYFDEVFDAFGQQHQSKQQPYMMVMFDLDGLKTVNDLYGHSAGDAYLIAFSDFLRELTVEGKHIARIGGDEFVALFEGEDRESLYNVLSRARETFRTLPIKHEHQVFFGNFSYGIALCPQDATDKSKLFQISDLMMYKDKHR